jgi:hypothetical protein
MRKLATILIATNAKLMNINVNRNLLLRYTNIAKPAKMDTASMKSNK